MTVGRWTLVVGIAAFLSSQVNADPPLREPDRIGLIVIAGNTQTPEWFIRGCCPLLEGAILNPKNLEVARERLAQSGMFDRKTPPTVAVDPPDPATPDSPFRTIRIELTERPHAWSMFVFGEAGRAIRTGDPVLMLRAADLLLDLYRPGR